MNAPFTASTGPGSSSPRSVARYWLRRSGADADLPMPVKCARADNGVGNDRLQAWSSWPEGRTSLQPTMPIAGSESMRSRQLSSAPSRNSVSGLSSRTNSASGSRRTRLLAAAKPIFPRRTRFTHGNSRATISGVGSGLPLSTTVTRRGLASTVVSNDRRQLRSSSGAPWLTIATTKRPAGSVGAASANYGTGRTQEDRDVLGDGEVVDVSPLESEPLLEGQISAAVDLHRAREPGLHAEAQSLALVIERDDGLLLRARSNQRHLAPEHVQQLWRLVETEPPEPPP